MTTKTFNTGRARKVLLPVALVLIGASIAPFAAALARPAAIATRDPLKEPVDPTSVLVAHAGATGKTATSTKPSKTKGKNDPDPVAAAVLMERTGLTPINLAAAGASAEQADAIALQMLLYTVRDEVLPNLHNATLALNESINHPAPDDGLVHPTTAELQANLDALLDAAREFALVAVSDAGTRELVNTVITTSAQWADIPAYYRTIDRGDGEYILLRGALSAQRYADATGNPLGNAPAQFLADANDDILVSASRTATEANLDVITTTIAQRLQ